MRPTSSSAATVHSTRWEQVSRAHRIFLPYGIGEQTALSYVADIPSVVVKDAALCGTPDEVLEQAAEWRDAGCATWWWPT